MIKVKNWKKYISFLYHKSYLFLPKNGYTQFINNIIDSNSKIKVHLNTDFLKLDKEFLKGFEHIIYTGPIDKYYEKSNFEKLEYRSINFDVIKINLRYLYDTYKWDKTKIYYFEIFGTHMKV